MFRVGLTGGIGSGKSEVARFFSEFGALVIDADESARAVTAIGTEGLAEIASAWPQVITPSGELDRSALAAIVFSDKRAREALNAIVHPRVRARGAQLEAQAAQDQLVVHVVPLLFEAGFAKRCDATVVVVAPVEQRIARVMARDETREEDVRSRIATQIDPEEAIKVATFVIRNDGDLRALRAETFAVYEQLRARALSR